MTTAVIIAIKANMNFKSIRLLSFLQFFVAVSFAANHPKCGLNGPTPLILESMMTSNNTSVVEDDDDPVDLGIIGGTEAKPHDYPWHGKLFIYESADSRIGSMCSCSILNSNWVLTAAHCLYDGESGEKVSHDLIEFKGGIHIFTGANEPWRSKRKVTTMHIHEHFNLELTGYENDLALLKLDSPLELEDNSKHIGAICLPSKGKDFYGKNCIITGWGMENAHAPHSETLRQLKLKVLNKKKCAKKWGVPYVEDRMICAGKTKGKGFCDGDSGGPLVCYSKTDKKWFQAGIASFADRFCFNETITHPSMFTKVDNYEDWIWHTIGQN